MKLITLAYVLSVALATWPALACESPEAVKAQALERYPDIRIHRHLKDDAADRFITGFNAIPPVTFYVGDEVLILRDPSYPHYRGIHFFEGGCHVGGGALSALATDSLLDPET